MDVSVLTVTIGEIALDGVAARDPRVAQAIEREVAHALRGRTLPAGVDAAAISAAAQTAIAGSVDGGR